MFVTCCKLCAGASGCAQCPQQQLSVDAQQCLERSPDLHGHDPGHPHVHGNNTSQQLLTPDQIYTNHCQTFGLTD